MTMAQPKQSSAAADNRDFGMANPNRRPDPPSNRENDPSDGVSGDEPMTGAQASYLKTLAEQAHELDAFSPALTKTEAARRIDALRAKLTLQDGPPHTI